MAQERREHPGSTAAGSDHAAAMWVRDFRLKSSVVTQVQRGW
jgi:hypothetical protein